MLIQKVKGTHNLEEAEAGEWPLDRPGNLNADAAANRVQLTASPSLPQAQQMVENWEERIQLHNELPSMLLDVFKAFMHNRKRVEREMANPLEDPWQAQWPRATHGFNKSPVGIAWTLAVAKHAGALMWGGPNRNTKQCDGTVTFIELAIDCYLSTDRWPPRCNTDTRKWMVQGDPGWSPPSLHELAARTSWQQTG